MTKRQNSMQYISSRSVLNDIATFFILALFLIKYTYCINVDDPMIIMCNYNAI